MANRDLLKEAIADAKAVKETAIANAKAALEEAFTPMLREKLAKKIAEMDELEETSLEYTKMSGQDYANFCKENPNDPGCLSEADEKEKKEVKENEEMDEAEDMDEAEKMDEVDLDELLRELESMDEDEMYEAETMDEAKEKDEKKKDLKEEEELINDPKKSTSHGNVAEEDEKKDDENWEKMSLGEKAQSGLARGIEKVGKLFFLDNMVREAQADRIKNESDYFAKKEGGGAAVPSKSSTSTEEFSMAWNDGKPTINGQSVSPEDYAKFKLHLIPALQILISEYFGG